MVNTIYKGGCLMLRMGVDAGNSTIILRQEGLDEPIIIPTVYADYKEYHNMEGLNLKNKENNESIEDNLDVEIILDYQNAKRARNLGRKLVGNLARKLEGTKSLVREIGKNKAGDDDLLFCMITTLAVGVIKDQKKEEGILSEDINQVTGLPYQQYKVDTEKFSEELKGKHKVIIRGKYNLEIEINNQEVEVDAEGAGSLNSCLFDAEGNYIYREEELLDRLLLGVDIGEFTSEVIALIFLENEKGEIYPEYFGKLCFGIDLGIANAKQPIIDKLLERYTTLVDRYEIDKVVKRKIRKGEIDTEAGKTYNILHDYERNIKELSNNISSVIANKVKNAGVKGRIKESLLFGGGPCVLDKKMGNFIREKLKNSIGGETRISENALTSNADGYLERALAIFE